MRGEYGILDGLTTSPLGHAELKRRTISPTITSTSPMALISSTRSERKTGYIFINKNKFQNTNIYKLQQKSTRLIILDLQIEKLDDSTLHQTHIPHVLALRINNHLPHKYVSLIWEWLIFETMLRTNHFQTARHMTRYDWLSRSQVTRCWAMIGRPIIPGKCLPTSGLNQGQEIRCDIEQTSGG